jgi:hypothetical protein
MYSLHIPSFNSTYLPMYLSCKFPLIFHHKKCGKISLGLILLCPRQSNIRILLNITLLPDETKSSSYCLEFHFFGLEPPYNIATLQYCYLTLDSLSTHKRCLLQTNVSKRLWVIYASLCLLDRTQCERNYNLINTPISTAKRVTKY